MASRFHTHTQFRTDERVSVVVPVRDEALTIGRTLDDLLAQSRRPDQIVFVDAGSNDGTGGAIARHPLAAAVPVRVVSAGPAYPGRARNLGVAASDGTWIAFTDGGVRLAPAWLATLTAAAAADPQAEAIAGDWDLDVATPFDRCLALLSAPTEGIARGALRPPVVVSLLLRRDAWDRAGPFREDLRSAEDRLFLTRLAAECRVIRAPGRLVRWRPPVSAAAAWRRFRVYARHNIRAGLFGEWQAPLLRRYALAGAGAIACAWWTPLPGALAAVALWTVLLTARAAKTLYANRGDGGGLRRSALDLARLVPLVALVDAATAMGTLDWLLRDAGRAPSRSSAGLY
jgi:glycosyltransferase involved in cell wall biosynthesis